MLFNKVGGTQLVCGVSKQGAHRDPSDILGLQGIKSLSSLRMSIPDSEKLRFHSLRVHKLVTCLDQQGITTNTVCSDSCGSCGPKMIGNLKGLSRDYWAT